MSLLKGYKDLEPACSQWKGIILNSIVCLTAGVGTSSDKCRGTHTGEGVVGQSAPHHMRGMDDRRHVGQVLTDEWRVLIAAFVRIMFSTFCDLAIPSSFF